MFSLFKGVESPEALKKKAKQTFDKVTALTADTFEANSLRRGLGLLSCAHLDKTFIAGAEQTAGWQELVSLSLKAGKPMPDAPTPSKFQKIRTGDSDVYAYLPEDYVIEAFGLGARYQKAELSAPKAIEAMQALANQISRYDLRLDEPFLALTFFL